jgi:hypothetical protein
MVSKTKYFPKLIPSVGINQLYLTEKTDEIPLLTLYRKLRVSLKKGINKICKEILMKE